MYYAFIENNKINGTGQCECLNEDIQNVEITEEIFNKIERYIWNGEQIILDPNYEEKQAQKEHERILQLSMTRSDFFDATIKAFGVDCDDLIVAIENILMTLPIDNIQKKIAINNYKNAQNFYRKHELFSILSNVSIEIGEQNINISPEQWDKFFDETDKHNPNAYEQLLS